MSICYGYGRHSTRKQGLTRAAQEQKTLEHWRQALREEGIAWGGFHYDEATSAGKPFSEREKGRMLYASAQRGDCIVVSKLDRLFRRLIDGVMTIEQLEQRGVRVIALDFPIDATNAIGKLIRNLLLSMAELERDLASERTEAVIEMRKAKGLPYSKGCPVGWKVCGEAPARYFRIDEEERRFVSRMTELREVGWSYDDIALWTMKQGKVKRTFPTRDQAKWAIDAKAAGYPKISGYKAFRKMLRSGEIRLCPA